jgi:hypothetical protein
VTCSSSPRPRPLPAEPQPQGTCHCNRGPQQPKRRSNGKLLKTPHGPVSGKLKPPIHGKLYPPIHSKLEPPVGCPFKLIACLEGKSSEGKALPMSRGQILRQRSMLEQVQTLGRSCGHFCILPTKQIDLAFSTHVHCALLSVVPTEQTDLFLVQPSFVQLCDRYSAMQNFWYFI